MSARSFWLRLREPLGEFGRQLVEQARLEDQVDPAEAVIHLAGRNLATVDILPADVFEAAEVDGASGGRMFWQITLPMLMPTVSVAALLRLIDALKTFDIIYAMTGGGPGYASETLNIYTYQQAFSYFSFGFASAALVVFFAIVLGMSLLVMYSRGVVEI